MAFAIFYGVIRLTKAGDQIDIQQRSANNHRDHDVAVGVTRLDQIVFAQSFEQLCYFLCGFNGLRQGRAVGDDLAIFCPAQDFKFKGSVRFHFARVDELRIGVLYSRVCSPTRDAHSRKSWQPGRCVLAAQFSPL